MANICLRSSVLRSRTESENRGEERCCALTGDPPPGSIRITLVAHLVSCRPEHGPSLTISISQPLPPVDHQAAPVKAPLPCSPIPRSSMAGLVAHSNPLSANAKNPSQVPSLPSSPILVHTSSSQPLNASTSLSRLHTAKAAWVMTPTPRRSAARTYQTRTWWTEPRIHCPFLLQVRSFMYVEESE